MSEHKSSTKDIQRTNVQDIKNKIVCFTTLLTIFLIMRVWNYFFRMVIDRDECNTEDRALELLYYFCECFLIGSFTFMMYSNLTNEDPEPNE